MLIFTFRIVLGVSTRTGLHALKTNYLSYTVRLNKPVFTLCLKRFVLAPVSLRPPEKAQSALISRHFRVFGICALGVSVASLQPKMTVMPL